MLVNLNKNKNNAITTSFGYYFAIALRGPGIGLKALMVANGGGMAGGFLSS